MKVSLSTASVVYSLLSYCHAAPQESNKNAHKKEATASMYTYSSNIVNTNAMVGSIAAVGNSNKKPSVTIAQVVELNVGPSTSRISRRTKLVADHTVTKTETILEIVDANKDKKKTADGKASVLSVSNDVVDLSSLKKRKTKTVVVATETATKTEISVVTVAKPISKATENKVSVLSVLNNQSMQTRTTKTKNRNTVRTRSDINGKPASINMVVESKSLTSHKNQPKPTNASHNLANVEGIGKTVSSVNSSHTKTVNSSEQPHIKTENASVASLDGTSNSIGYNQKASGNASVAGLKTPEKSNNSNTGKPGSNGHTAQVKPAQSNNGFNSISKRSTEDTPIKSKSLQDNIAAKNAQVKQAVVSSSWDNLESNFSENQKEQSDSWPIIEEIEGEQVDIWPVFTDFGTDIFTFGTDFIDFTLLDSSEITFRANNNNNQASPTTRTFYKTSSSTVSSPTGPSPTSPSPTGPSPTGSSPTGSSVSVTPLSKYLENGGLSDHGGRSSSKINSSSNTKDDHSDNGNRSIVSGNWDDVDDNFSSVGHSGWEIDDRIERLHGLGSWEINDEIDGWHGQSGWKNDDENDLWSGQGIWDTENGNSGFSGHSNWVDRNGNSLRPGNNNRNSGNRKDRLNTESNFGRGKGRIGWSAKDNLNGGNGGGRWTGQGSWGNSNENVNIIDQDNWNEDNDNTNVDWKNTGDMSGGNGIVGWSDRGNWGNRDENNEWSVRGNRDNESDIDNWSGKDLEDNSIGIGEWVDQGNWIGDHGNDRWQNENPEPPVVLPLISSSNAVYPIATNTKIISGSPNEYHKFGTSETFRTTHKTRENRPTRTNTNSRHSNRTRGAFFDSRNRNKSKDKPNELEIIRTPGNGNDFDDEGVKLSIKKPNKIYNIEINPNYVHKGNSFDSDSFTYLENESSDSFKSSLKFRPNNFFGGRFEYLFKNYPEFCASWDTSELFRDNWNNNYDFRKSWFSIAFEK
ncbi:hypothetical protein AYI70_g971 [Smittium culicis]|uniref:Uncharacterized protein n=1 Tax=Smittium culicis TaxID=133412 RepID=A0A1R1YEM0_9FUNG|nr:hypothetical protein AYI70_g971 [Smittium culicis]